jgi:hypothetical protein
MLSSGTLLKFLAPEALHPLFEEIQKARDCLQHTPGMQQTHDFLHLFRSDFCQHRRRDQE